MINRCYWKGVSELTNQNGKTIREDNPNINFRKCRYSCSGFKDYGTCDNYLIKFYTDEEIELLTELDESELEDEANCFDMKSFGMMF